MDIASQDTPAVSVVMVTWNARQEVLASLESLKANPPAAPWEAILVDNASTDGTVDAVRRGMPWVRVVANPVNRGLAAGNNQGMSAARGNTIVLSNPDVLFTPGALQSLADALGRRSNAAFVFARLLNEDGTIQTSAGALPTFRQALMGRGRQPISRGRPPFKAMWWDGWSHDEEVPVGHGGEACYTVRRAALDAIGPQDERFVLDWEGLDWCARASQAGWEVWFTPTADVVHLGGRSTSKAQPRWVVTTHKGMFRYFALRSPAWLRPVIAILVAVRALVKLVAVGLGYRYTGSATPTHE